MKIRLLVVWRSCLDVEKERRKSRKHLFTYLNDSNDVGEASFQEVTVNEHAKGETSAAVAVDQLADEPRTWRNTQ